LLTGTLSLSELGDKCLLWTATVIVRLLCSVSHISDFLITYINVSYVMQKKYSIL